MRLARARQNDAQQFLRRRLADGPGDGDDSRLGALARRPAEILERGQRVLRHVERTCARKAVGVRLVDQRRRGAGLERLADIVVTVGIISLQRNEEVAVLQRARVDGDAGDAARRQAAAHPCAERRNQRERCPEGVVVRHASPASAARTAS